MVKVRYKKSGVQYGYAYGHGEIGTMSQEAALRMQALWFIKIIEAQTIEKPTYETPEMHTGFTKIEKRKK